MSLRSKILLILAVAIVLFAGVDHVIQQRVIFEQFVDLEREEAEKDLQRVVQALDGEIRHLDRRCEDWATWDDTFAYVAEPNPGYVASNLGDDGLRKNGLNLLYICDTQGRVAWGRILDLASGQPIAMREFPGGAVSTSHPLIVGEPRRSGLWMTERGPMLVSSKPILDSRRQGPSRGTVIMGRLLTAALEKDLAARTGVAFDALALESEALSAADQAGLDEVTGAAAPVVRVVDDERLHAWTTFPDMREAPALLIRAEIPRAITGQGAASVRYALISTVAAGFLIMLVLLNLLQRTVLRPIAALTGFAVEIGRSDETSRKLNLVRGDEIGVLSREFDSMLEKLSQSRAAVVKTARAAGMSEIATAVLHNVGNVLNSVNVAATLVGQKVRASSAVDLGLAMRAVEESAGDLAAFLEKDPRGKHLYPLLRSIAEQMAAEQQAILGEVKTLTEGIDHIRDLVQAQQGYAGKSGVLERASFAGTIESALAMTGREDGIEFVRDFEDLPPSPIDRHRVTEVLVNVIRNARDAVEEGAPDAPRICLRLRRPGPGRARIEVEDNGVGIPHENLTRVFTHGFTTKKHGHGFGLHSSANAAVEMKGTLSARSDGPGRGATFVLELPVQEAAASGTPDAAEPTKIGARA